jgi:hypothetical protein
MSLWNKVAESITFADIDSFCLQKHKEGPRLDYKADVPNDLQKLVSAFANTNGGLIILGVDSDPSTNEPIWPPLPKSRGLPEGKGIEERIVAICRDNILPPLVPHISPIVPNAHLPKHVLVVMRVDESPEAPHAVNEGRRIYERTGSLSHPIDFAHIDRIQHLLDRRQRVETNREASIQSAVNRTIHQLSGRQLHYVQPMGTYGPDNDAEYWMCVPLRWASVIPYYPWRDLCTPEKCYSLHRALQFSSMPSQIQRMPGGSFGIHQKMATGSRSGGRSSLSSKGHLFAIEWAHEALFQYQHAGGGPQKPKPEDFWISFDDAEEFVRGSLSAAATFFSRIDEIPGYLLASVGYLDVRYYRMYRRLRQGDNPMVGDPIRGQRFPEQQFRADLSLHVSEIISEPEHVVKKLLNQLAFGFDLPAIP